MEKLNQTLIDFIVKKAKNMLYPRAIIVFGSRARGDAHARSDYDIAFDFDNALYQDSWGRFCIETVEEAPTLLHIDLVNMNKVDTIFKSKILQEGIVVYKGE